MKEVDVIEQSDGSEMKMVYDSDTGKHDAYSMPDGPHDHIHYVWYDSTVTETGENTSVAAADYVREDGEVLYDTGFHGPSSEREDYFG